MNLLIDNCTLIRFVHSEAYGQYLLDLENYVKGGHIRLLTHELILEEWEKHKESNRKRIVKKLQRQNNSLDANSNDQLPMPISVDHIELQYQQIDRLLSGALRLRTPEVIQNEFSERYRKRLAPFHNKLNSQNDWEIFGSVAHYCEINSIQELYFLSANDGDFADKENPQNIHPDLRTRFSRLQIIYFAEIAAFLSSMGQLVLPERFLAFNIVRNEKFSHKASVRKNELDSLYHLLSNMYEEVAFIPNHLLCKYHPFANSKNSYTYFSLFALNHVRVELVELLSNVSIEGENVRIINENYFSGVKNAQEKLEYCLLRLSNNLIFRLNSDKGNKTADTRYHGRGRCECIRCNYSRLAWHKSLSLLNQTEGNLHEQLKTAYYHYRMGFYNSAARLTFKLREAALKEKKFVIYYICQYNLYHFGRLSANPFSSTSLNIDELAALKAIDPVEECVKLKSHTDYDLLAYISDHGFFNQSFETISDLVAQIEDNYYSSLKGGWSSNSHAYQLAAEFAQLEAFIDRNCLVYNVYSNWTKLFELITKGLFASHAMLGSGSSALDSFDDFWISAFIFYGNRKTIDRYFRHFKLKELAYISTQPDGDFLQMALQLICNEKEMQQTLTSIDADGKGRFLQRFNVVFQNILTMAGLLEPNAFRVDLLAKPLITLLKTESCLNHFSLEAVADFIWRKGKYISKSVRQSYLSHFVKHIGRYNPDILTALVYSAKKGSISDNKHEKILNSVLQRELKESHDNGLGLLTQLARCSTPAQLKRMSNSISQKLDVHFDFSLFYRATMHDIIPLNQERLFQLLDELDLKKKRYSFRTLSTGEEDEYLPRLDELLSICFKYEIPLRGRRLTHLKTAGPYYNWLLAMDTFDYRKFRFEWVNHYKTDAYRRHLSKSPKLHKMIIDRLRKETSPELERALINISFTRLVDICLPLSVFSALAVVVFYDQ
jgi:hypothetical protein